jgi:hypothetical protein
MISRMKIKSWDSDIIYAYKDNGVMVAALKYYKDNRITKPEGYSAAEVEKIYEKYKEADNSDVAEERADKIIVIMNESFADMDKYCDAIATLSASVGIASVSDGGNGNGSEAVSGICESIVERYFFD